MHLRSFCVGLSLCGAALGQGRVWTVDQGGGAQFTEIQPAIDAASPGDRIEVRGAWTYPGFTLSKGLDLEATQGASVAGCSIRLVRLEEWVRVAGFTVVGQVPGTFGRIAVWRCAGPVLLSGMHTPDHSGGDGLYVGDALSVWVRGSTVRGGSGVARHGSTAVTLFNANVTFQRCDIAGGSGYGAIPSLLLAATPGGAGMSAVGGDVLVAQCSVSGGPGGNGSGPLPPAPGGIGLGAAGGLLVSGGSVVRGGLFGLPSSAGPNSAIVGDSQLPTAVRVTSDCTLVGATPHVAVIPPVPWLVSSGTAPLGGKADLTLRGPQGTVALLLFDFVHAHVALPGIDGALLLPAASVTGLFPVAIGSGSSLLLSFPVPNDPLLRNQFAFFQVAGLTPVAPLPFLSNLGDFRLR